MGQSEQRYFEPIEVKKRRWVNDEYIAARRHYPSDSDPPEGAPATYFRIAGAALTSVVNRIVTYDTEGNEAILEWIRRLLEPLKPDLSPYGSISEVGDQLTALNCLVLSDWLLGVDSVNYAAEADALFRSYVALEPPDDRFSQSLLMVDATACGVHQPVIDTFKQLNLANEPKKPYRIRYADQLAYMASSSILDAKYTTEEVRQAAKHVFDREMDEWIGNGHAVRAARWLKIIYSDLQPSLGSPTEVILKCYDHLPEKTRQEAEQLRLGIKPKQPW